MDLFDALPFSHCSELNLGIFFLGIFQQRCGEIQLVAEEQIHKKAENGLYRICFCVGIYFIWVVYFSNFFGRGRNPHQMGGREGVLCEQRQRQVSIPSSCYQGRQ